MPTALIVHPDMEVMLSLADVFRKHGYTTQTAQNLRAAREVLLQELPEVAMLAEYIGEEDSLALLEELDVSQVTEIYLMSRDRSVGTATRAMRAGVTDYFDEPVDLDRLAANLEQLGVEPGASPDDSDVGKDGRGLLVGESLPMQRLYRLIRKCAPTDASVLLFGESGTGKELVAQTIHRLSRRSAGPFLPVNCSAVPTELMESELFGHRKGSFTGATRNHKGFFESATGGTLFLDEITEMPPELQAKLLRVLESSRVRPIGAEKHVEIDARVIAATNQDPQAAIESGRLREDLYYRLAQFPLGIAPLRDRGDDGRLLAQHFLEKQNLETGVNKTFSEEVLDAFQLHDWPGNVRELKNAVFHGHLLAGSEIRLNDLPDGIPSTIPAGGQFVRLSVGLPLREVQLRYTLSTLAHFDGNKKKAAKTLGISLKTLYNRLKEYGAG